MEMIDAQWIKSRLTGRHGEKGELASAIGIEPDKLTKILNGTRQVQANEVFKIIKYFALTNENSFQEDAALPLRNHAEIAKDRPNVIAALAPRAIHPLSYTSKIDIPWLSIGTGDTLIVDQSDHADGLSLVNIWHPEGFGETQLRRRFGSMVISLDPSDPMPIGNLDSDQRFASLGRLVAKFRTYDIEG